MGGFEDVQGYGAGGEWVLPGLGHLCVLVGAVGLILTLFLFFSAVSGPQPSRR